MGAVLSWLLDRARDLWNLQAPVKVSLLQTFLATVAVVVGVAAVPGAA